MIIDKEIIYNDKQYMDIVKNIISNDLVKQMKQYRQHYNVNCFDHCLYVSYNLYLICKKRNLDYTSAARAALVHDLFLYDWRKKTDGRKGLHAYTHAKLAYKNAKKVFILNDIEKDIVLKHMWPVTVALPKYKESFLMTFVDKYFAWKEKYIKS